MRFHAYFRSAVGLCDSAAHRHLLFNDNHVNNSLAAFRLSQTWLSVTLRRQSLRLASTISTSSPTNQSGLNVCFLGTDAVSIPTLAALHDSLRGRGEFPGLVTSLDVVCPGDRPAGRGLHSQEVPVKTFAVEHDLTRLEVPYGLRDLRQWRPVPLQGRSRGNNQPTENEIVPFSRRTYDVGVVVSFGYFLRENILSAFRWGAINVHPSLLPRWRGAAPVPHTLLAGDTVTGVSIIAVHPTRMDAGRILAQETTLVRNGNGNVDVQSTHPSSGSEAEGARALTARLAQLGAVNVLRVLRDMQLAAGPLEGRPQSEEGATHACKFWPHVAIIRWNDISAPPTAQWLLRAARAFDAAFGGLTTYFEFGKPVGTRKRVKLKALAPVPTGSTMPKVLQARGVCSPGSLVYDAYMQRLYVAAAPTIPSHSNALMNVGKKNDVSDWVEILELHVETKRVARGLDFANGYHITENSGHHFVEPPQTE